MRKSYYVKQNDCTLYWNSASIKRCREEHAVIDDLSTLHGNAFSRNDFFKWIAMHWRQKDQQEEINRKRIQNKIH